MHDLHMQPSFQCITINDLYLLVLHNGQPKEKGESTCKFLMEMVFASL